MPYSAERRLLLIASGLSVLLGASAHAGPLLFPIHEYLFEGDAADSVGTADGTVGANVIFDSSGEAVCQSMAAVFGSGTIGQNDEILVDVADFDGFGTGDFTIAFWVSRANVDIDNNDGIFDALANSTVGWQMKFLENDTIRFRFDDDMGGTVTTECLATFPDDRWRHVAVSVDRSSATGGMWIIDGVVDSTFDPTPASAAITSTQHLHFGANENTNGMEGALAAVQFYDIALFDNEVLLVSGLDTDFDHDGIPDECEPAVAVMYVDADATGASDGSSWADAHRSLRTATIIAENNPGVVTEIRVAQGTYQPDGGYQGDSTGFVEGALDFEAYFTVPSGAAFVGGYAGGGEADPDLYDPVAHPTILSGQLDEFDNAPHAWGMLRCDAVAVGTTISGFTIRDVSTASPTHDVRGGLEVTAGSTLSVVDCLFINCQSAANGGAVTAEGADLTITDCLFDDNAVDSSNTTFEGGALYAVDCQSLVLERCDFTNNSSFDWGGAVGIIADAGHTVQISDCRFIDNMSVVTGALHLDTFEPATIDRCVFQHNTACDLADAATLIGPVTMTNSLIAGHEMAFEAWLLHWSGPLRLTNCTIVDNESDRATFNSEDSNVDAVFSNCIIRGNTPGPFGLIHTPNDPGSVEMEYSNVQGGYAGTGNINLDPLFVDPDGADDDPDTYLDNDYRLGDFSPCADAGNNGAEGLVGLVADLDGAARYRYNPLVADTGVGVAPVIDMGAYEGMVCAAMDDDFDADTHPDLCEPWLPVMYVDADATGLSDGSSWTDAHASLRTALLIAGQNLDFDTEIRVAQGVYYADGGFFGDDAILVPGSGNRNHAFDATDSLTLVGGYAGAGEADPNLIDPVAHPTVLSGAIDGADSRHVLRVNGVSAVTIAGFEITEGQANGSNNNQRRGAGLLVQTSSDLTISACVFRDNETLGLISSASGAAIFMEFTSATITGCVFDSNSSAGDGGGVSMNTSEVEFERCLWINNTGGRLGGGLFVASSVSATIKDCEFIQNSSSVEGGAVWCTFVNTTFLNSSFLGNTASGLGGAISVSGSTDYRVINCSVIGNSAAPGIGAIHTDDTGSLFFGNCIIRNGGVDEVFIEDGMPPVIEYSNVEGGYLGTGNIDAAPVFVDADGADDDAMTFDDNDYRLDAGSPGIDAGDNTPPELAGVTTDLGGDPRFVDDASTADTGVGPAPIVDMGAYEFGGAVSCPGDVNGDMVVDAADLGILIGQFGSAGPEADINGDGIVDAADLGLLIGAFGTTCP